MSEHPIFILFHCKSLELGGLCLQCCQTESRVRTQYVVTVSAAGGTGIQICWPPALILMQCTGQTRCLELFLWAPNIIPRQPGSHTAYGNSEMFCAMLWECSGCSLVTDRSWWPKRGHCHGRHSDGFLLDLVNLMWKQRNYTDVITWVNKCGISLNWEKGSVFLLG